MSKIIASLLVFIFLFNISACSKNTELIYETNQSDLNKSCSTISHELYDLQANSLRRAKRSHTIQNVKNTGLVVAAIPTLFFSLFFLDFSDETNIKTQEIENRINTLTKLQKFKECPASK